MIKSIQYLRGIAALMILLHHVYRTILMNKGFLPDWLGNTVAYNFAVGVDIFFVISGFVIYLAVIERPKTVKQFAIDRLSRIAPAYWFYTIIFAVVITLFPWTHPSSIFETWHFIKSMLFIPSLNPTNMKFFPTLVVGWTLNHEMMFYVLFSAALLFGTNKLHLFIVAFISLFYVISNNFDFLSFYAIAGVFEFALGVVIARLYAVNKDAFCVSKSVSALVLILSFYILLFIEGNGFITRVIPSALILYSVVCIDKYLPKIEFFEKLGDSSYSLYLSHKIFICLGLVICRYYGIKSEMIAIPVIIFSILLSFITYKYVEIMPSRKIRKVILT